MTEPFKIKSNLAGLCEVCRDILTKIEISDINVSPSLISLGVSIIDAFPENYVADGFIERTAEWWPQILSRDEDFWATNCRSIFPEMPDDYARDFVRILGHKDISVEDRENAWKILHGAVRCSIRHIHEMRCPRISGGKMSYKRQYMSNVDLSTTALEWGVHLK